MTLLISSGWLDPLSLSCETSAVVLSDDSEDAFTRSESRLSVSTDGANLTLRGDLHESMSDAPLPGQLDHQRAAAHSPPRATCRSTRSLPWASIPTARPPMCLQASETQPTLTTRKSSSRSANCRSRPSSRAITRGDIDERRSRNEPALTGAIARLEKPLQDTMCRWELRPATIPGISRRRPSTQRSALCDWSQIIVDAFSWHSYAEVLNSHGLLDQAPAAPHRFPAPTAPLRRPHRAATPTRPVPCPFPSTTRP